VTVRNGVCIDNAAAVGYDQPWWHGPFRGIEIDTLVAGWQDCPVPPAMEGLATPADVESCCVTMLSVGRHVALKVLPFAAVLDPKQLQRFKNEAQAAAALDHPNIVHVHCVGCQRGVHYYAMQLIEGQTLADVIAELRAGQQLPSEGQRAIAKATAATRTRQ
jgi:serine/threonine protein kinase